MNDAGRENVIVSTKLTPQMAAMYDNSVEKMCDASLARMNMEYFDIYWIHNPIVAPEYTKQLIPLLKNGKVKSVGVSNHNLAQIIEAEAILRDAGFRLSAVQNHYSLLNRSSEESASFSRSINNKSAASATRSNSSCKARKSRSS